MINNINHSPKNNRRPVWPFIIVGLLGLHVIGMCVAFAIATHDKTFLVVPDYYDKAQHWDQTRAEQLASQALGWRIAVQADHRINSRGERAVTFVLTDRDGKPVKDAALHVDYFHRAHPDQQRKADLTADSGNPINYSGTIPMLYPGMWEMRFTVKAGQQVFTSSILETVTNG